MEIKLMDTSKKIWSLFKNPESVLMNRKCFKVREGFRKKRKKLVEFSTKGLTPPPPALVEKIFIS